MPEMTLSRKIRSFDGAVAIITGGGTATGAALGRELARRGCEVVLADHLIDRVEPVATEIQDEGGTATATEIDVIDSWDVEALLYATIRRVGRLDYMFNYAGDGLCSTAFGRKFEDWDTMMEINLCGIIHGFRAAYQVMLDQGFGHIVNIAPIVDLFPVSEDKRYAITRHAIIGFSNAMRFEAASSGIRISALCPDFIGAYAIDQDMKYSKGIMKLSPQQLKCTKKTMEPVKSGLSEVFAVRALDAIARNEAIIVTSERAKPFVGSSDVLKFPQARLHLTRVI